MLVLGDSYTIGQSVPVNDRWPFQLADSLVAVGVLTDTIHFIATTGWRTDELLNAISGKDLENGNYNLVSLLIGVNNQYQERPFSQYATEFPILLDSAIRFAGGDKSHVFVVSIPDYAYTPVGQQSSDPAQVSNEIDLYNNYNKYIADSLGITYFNITGLSRLGLLQPTYVANDGLHPSTLQYSKWVELMIQNMHPEVLTRIHLPYNKLNAYLYPNPASCRLFIETGMPGQEYQLRIYSAAGILEIDRKFCGSSSSVDIAVLPPGLYTCKINSGHRYVVKKLVID